MAADIRKLFSSKVVNLVGSGKNAGKTTLMLWLLGQCRCAGLKVGVISTGIDGEGRDTISGHFKPEIRLCPGDFVVTGEEALRLSSARFEILRHFDSSVGDCCLAKTVREGKVELNQPGSRCQMIECVEAMRDECDLVFVDGAFGRQSHAGIPGSCYVIVAHLEPEHLQESLNFLELHSLYSKIPIALPDEELSHEGALTEKMVASQPVGKKFCVQDFTRLFLPASTLRSLLKENEIRVKVQYSLCAVLLRYENCGKDELSRYPLFNDLPLMPNPFVA